MRDKDKNRRHQGWDVNGELWAWENLWEAYRNASRGKRDHRDVAAFELLLGDNSIELEGELRDKTYRPGPYHSFYIHEPKRRLISAALFRDRVVHHALCRITVPAFERLFFGHSYANRVGKGTHRAPDRCQSLA